MENDENVKPEQQAEQPPEQTADQKPEQSDEAATVPASTVEALKSAYETKIANIRKDYQAQIDAQNEVIRGIFGGKGQAKPCDYMTELVTRNNTKWARRKF